MKKLIAAMALALTATACGGEDPVVTIPSGEVQSPSPGASPPAASTNAPGYENVPIPPISPDPPAQGESTNIEMKIEAAASEPLGQQGRPMQPAVVLARSPEEAEVVAKVVPPGAADILRSWKGYGKRALIAVLGGPQPDAGYAIKLEGLSVTRGGKVVSAFGQITSKGGASNQVITVPWVVASVNYASVVLVERCVLAMSGTTARQSRCHGAR